MMRNETKENLQNLVKGEILFDEPLSRHSSIKIGGRCDAFITPLNRDEVSPILQFAKEAEMPVFIMGGGSNILFRDGGFSGLVVATSKLRNVNLTEQGGGEFRLMAEAGVPIGEIVTLCLKEGLSGFENLAGIPGTIGGGLAMNAGTRRGCISEPLLRVEAVDKSGHSYSWPKGTIEFSYRRARYPKSSVLLAGEFLLKKGVKGDLEKKVSELHQLRRERQPLKWPSLGSIFKNPEKGPPAGQLIEEAGLKGVRVGGARISAEHGNWIVNEDSATSKDVEILVALAKERVKENAQVLLETEIVIVGEEMI